MATPQELREKAAKAVAAQTAMDAAKKAGTPKAVEAAPVKQGRTFYARIHHSKFIFSDNTEAIFAFGKLEVSPVTFPGFYNRPTGHNQQESKENGTPKWEVYLKELNAIVPPNGSNPNIYTDDTVGQLENLPLPNMNAVDEVSVYSADSSLAGKSNVRVQQQYGPVTLGEAPANVNSSTLDKDLLQASQRSGATPLGNTDTITRIDPESLEGRNAVQSTS